MGTDERLKWLEMRISSSLRPRNEDLKNMMTNDDNRLAFYEFVNNEDVKRLFVFMRPGRQIAAALQPPMELQTKSIFFLKCNPGTKLTKDNLDAEVFYMDTTQVPLEHLELTIREVFLPLLATNTQSLTSSAGSGDKVMDILHRLMAAVEVSQGHIEGRIVLNLPSIEVLAEAAASPTRRAAVLHVLETTVIGWIKQIRGVLRHDPQTDLLQQFGKEPGPLDEIHMWEKHLARLQSLDDQLDSDVARDILQNLETANSQYAHSFNSVRKDIAKAESETSRILKFLTTLEPWYTRLHTAEDPKSIIKLFKPLMHVLNLVWAHSTYYHQIDKFHQLLRLLSNEVVHRAIAMVGDDILREPLESYSKLKEALRVCAAFRGTYLDFKDVADDQNAQNIAENAEKLAARPQGNLFKTKMYGPHAYTPRYGLRHLDGGSSSSSVNEEDLWTDSPWPARNAPSFDLLNSFMERCNDVLELVETTRHFRLLAGAAEVGGAGSASLDAMVKELHTKYTLAMKEFFSQVKNVLSIDGTQMFERAFFNFRTTVKSLEKRLSGILRLAFEQCPIVQAQLRLLEVFEGISGRELVQLHLKDIDKSLVENFIGELQQVKEIFKEYYIAPPSHYNMPPTVSKLMWVRALKERIKIPMDKMKQVSPHSLEGDRGWEMRETYTEVMQELEKFEVGIISKWQSEIVSELTHKLKQPLLIAEEYDDDIDVRPQVIHVNLDPQLLLLLKEIHYLSKPPFSIHLPESAKELLRNTNSQHLSVTATRLETIVSKYNSVMRSITAFERPMFERKLVQIDNLLEQGLQHHTWKMKESADFIESAMSLVCLDVHQNLDIVQTNCHEIAEMTMSWSKGMLDVFSAREKTKSYSMDELLAMHKQLNDELEGIVTPAGCRIHSLVQESYEVVQISQASPAWRDYVDYIDAIVLDGLKQATLSSLKIMLNTLVQANLVEDPEENVVVPILTIRLELIENNVAFRPPLDQSTAVVSVQELVQTWLLSYVARGKLVAMLGLKGSYEDYISADDEVKQLLADINQVVDENSEECKKLLDVFKEYAFLWQQDVNQTFEDFLSGFITPNPLRTRSAQRTVAEKQANQQQALKSERSSQASRASSAKSGLSAEVLESAERTFLTPKAMQEGEKSNVPSLDEFDQEIDIYRTARDEIMGLEEYHNVGWIRVDLQPIKQVLTTYASKWMWTFTKYLSDQVTSMLEKLDMFLKRIEPEIENITGEERDTASFMKMMRLFNEVSAQQSEMDGKFAAMHRTVLLLKKYGQILPEKTQFLFNAAPGRWNNLKTKVSLAKQRLGPRIQEESASITQDLEAFAVRVMSLSDDLDNSDVYQRECNISDAYNIIDGFSKRLVILENEAQDLIELQELLEASVVNFSVLPTCRHELNNLKQVWETVRVIEEQQVEWKRHRWQKMNTKFLREETNKQLDIVRALPEDVFTWDVYMGLHESITTIQACLPLIDDLSNPAMRTRHWKQLVRVTGGALTIDNDTLKRMTLRELLSLGLQQHVDDVRAIVQRAVKDLAIENALKTYEEVWLSKVFELRHHVRNKVSSSADVTQDNQSEYSQSEVAGPVSTNASRNARTTSRVSNQSSHSKNKRSSISSLPASLLNLGEDPGSLMLLTSTDPIFEELEHHQVTLQAMQSNSAAGSFLDEVLKWQKRLQTIEAVLQMWLEVQDKWVEMEEVYTSTDVRQSLSHDANRFGLVNKDFRLLMRATEKNPNVLQCCSRKNILKILEHMGRSLEVCRKSLLHHLERRRQIFPRFFFLSMEDVLRIVCNGYDLSMVNLYISKLLENVNCLVYEEADDNDRYSFVITGVQSALGERLNFNQVVCCEGQIETWLSTLLQQLKATLQAQLTRALGHEKNTRPKTREIHSAGARKVSVPVDDKSQSQADGSVKPSTPEGTVNQTTDETHEDIDEESAGSVFGQHTGRSWTLDHVTEIVHLATRVQMTTQITDALEEFNKGDKDALMECLKKIDSSIKATVMLLKGLEGEKEVVTSQQKEKHDLNGFGQDISGDRDLDSDMEIPGARSPPRKGSQDVGGEATRSPLGEDENMGSSRVVDGDGETSTIAPLDTMNLIIPPPTVGGSDIALPTNTEGQDEADGIPPEKLAELKLMLFPSQINKLTSLLSLLAHLRDLMQRLIEISEQQTPTESFDWKSQLNYEYDEEEKVTSVTCMKAKFDYGFEYLGSTNREVISPLTERVFVMITQAIQAHVGMLCMGPREGTKFELVHEISKCLGQPLYVFNCAKTTDYSQLQDIFRGLASTGCWVCFNDISLLKASCLSLLAQMMSTIMDALRAGKAAVHLQSDDVQLSPHGACFGLMNSAVPVTPRDSDKLLIYPSAVAQLPDMVLNQFRIISLTKPDLLLSLQVMLFSQGFMYGRELAWKINQLYEACCNMFGTNTFVSNNVTLGNARSASFYGWSIQSLKGVVEEAGAMLEKAQMEDKETGLSTIQHYDGGDKSQDEEQSETLVMAAKKLQQEEEALVTGLRDTFLPRMTARDASVFATMVNDLWPNIEVPMMFGGEEEVQGGVKKYDSLQTIRSEFKLKSQRSQDSQRSIKDSLNLNTPVVPMIHASTEKFSAALDTNAKQVLEDINDAIAVATADLGLLPGTAFQARVMQLAHLNTAHQSILVVGPPGCGKSECIKTFAVAERERGRNINVQSVFTKAVESGELLGYFEEKTGEWKDGLLTALLRKFCVTQPNSSSEDKSMMKIMQLDGECDSYQMELLQTILNHSGSAVLANSERLNVPDTLRFIWELESLENMSPSLLATVGVLVMTPSDVGWKLILVQWLEHRNEPDKDLLTEFCNIYLETVVDYITRCTQPAMLGTKKKPKGQTQQFKRVISHSMVNMIRTFTNLLEVLVNPFNDLSDVEYERYFNYAAVWAFGGTLAEEHREDFSDWWKEQFEDHIDYPTDGTVFDYIVDNETHEFCKWADLVPSYTGTPHKGIPNEAFVHTVHTEQLLHLLGLLTDAGKPVMLVGENGCGKTAIINERIRTVCSGEVAEVLSLTVYANRFTNARLLFDRIDERLEWKHGRTFVPKGNKRLLCLVDDINLSQTDSYGFQTACELIREHLDDGGFYSPTNHMWRYVKSVTYVTSVNPQTTANVPALSQRLLRHFAVFGCPYPGANELQTIFSTLLSTHFFTPETSGSSSSAAQHLGIHDDKVQGNVRFDEESLRKVVHSIVKVTVELSDRMRSMFLPTSQRCHYVFTTKDLGTIFRNLCLSLQPGCNKRNILLLWQHECFWVYGKRMVNEVDFRRFRQAFVTAVRKQFIDDDQIQTIIRPRAPLFSNLIEQDSGVVTAGMIDTRSSANVSEEDAKTDLYRPAKSFAAIKELLDRGVEEYNKIHPRIKLALYKSVIEQVCRLSRIIASPHEGANTVLVAEGCPARCTIIVRLAANLCGFTIYQISPTAPSVPTQRKMEQFKADLVSGYTRAGAKGEKVLLVLKEEELADKDYLVFLTEFIISGAITHLFSHEEQTTIINSIRTEVTQAGLTYTRDVAWNFFLRTVRNNFRIILIHCGGAEEFQHLCREYPAFTKNVNFLWFPHWSKTQLIDHAVFHLASMKWMTDIQRENVAHMLASMHLVLRQQDGGEKTSGEYGHVNNTSYEKFVERFISLANEKNKDVMTTHEAVTKTLEQIRHENEVAIKLKRQLEHEMVVLEERKAGTIKILSQIGQDTAITEQQIRVVRNQMEKITNLKQRLPEYQVAHERAVYKAIAIVADTKKVVKLMDIDDLAELRAMQKPALDIEDLMSAIIMLLKSPSADLTWQKGAKRQMANLERFIEELTTFDDFQLPESTLILVEPYLRKPSFEPETMEKKTNNSACGALCKWVRGVVRYHRMMISKVKPLHQKVEETTQAVDNAQHRMNTLENKRKALEIRLADLARGFEEATIDKNEQEEKTIRMKKMLDTAAQLRRILRGERQRCQQIFDSYERRLVAIAGGCAMAAAFTSYLGPYHHNFRRVMLTVHWPGCLRERGIPLVIDSVDGLRGRVIDWSIGFLKTASGASSVYEVDYATLVQNMDGSGQNGQGQDEDDDENVKDKPDNEEKEEDEAEKTEGEDDEGESGDNSRETGGTKGSQRTKSKATADGEDEERKDESDVVDSAEKKDEEKGEEVKSQPGSDKPVTPGEARSEAKTPKSKASVSDSGKPKTPAEKSGTPGKKSKTPASDKDQKEKTEDKSETSQQDSAPKTPKEGVLRTPTTPKKEESVNFEEGLGDVYDVPRLSKIQEEDGDMDDGMSDITTSTAPILTSVQYNRYVRSLIKILVGESTLNQWLMKDFGPRQIENAAILCTSWQRPPMMIDPNNEGSQWLGSLNKIMNKGKLISLDMENRTGQRTLSSRRSDPHIMSSLEKAITKGKPVLMRNCAETIDNLITPLVHHRNTANEKDMEEEPRMILFCGRRTLCHPDFRLYLSTHLSKPQFNPVMASSVTLINFGVSHDTLTEDLLTRAFARIRPELYLERNHALKNLQLQKDTLYKLSETVKEQVLAGGQEAMLSSSKALQYITNITDAKLQLAHQLANTQAILDDLDLLKDELYPVARRASLMYSLMRSLAAIYPEYQFTMKYFLDLFDEAIGGEFPPEFLSTGDEEGFEEEDSVDEAAKRKRAGSVTSQGSNGDKQEGGKDATQKGEEEEAADQGEEESKQAPVETEGSISTNAVQKLVHGSDSDELPTIEMPETVQLPSEGVEYTSYTTGKVKKLMDCVTSLVYHRIKMCLFEEDRLLYSTLMCLNMKVEAGEDVTNEEMSLFLQGNPGLGMQLNLTDFDCKAEPPVWLPREKWEDILALSVLPGPLDSLCIDFATNSESWKEWYECPYPEKETLPFGREKKEEDEPEEKVDEGTEKDERAGGRGEAGLKTPDLGYLNDFHHLLILRMLRPDRLPTALLSYTQRHLSLYDPEEEVFNVNEVLGDARKHWGVLVLLPPPPSDPSGHPASRIKLTKSPVDELLDLAKAVNISVERAVMSEGNYVLVEEALDSADKNEGWAIIESIHLATPAVVTKLIQHLQRIHKSRVNFQEEKGEEESKFCVWLTSETGSALPQSLVLNLLKISWNSVLSYPDLAKTESDAAGDKKPVEIFNPLSPRSYLKTAIVSSLRLISEEVLESLAKESSLIKGLVFSVAVIHGILVSRQLFGSVGLASWHPFGVTQINNAVEFVTAPMLRPRDMSEPSLEDLCFTIPTLIYGAMVSEEADKTYISTLCSHILTSIYQEPQSEILLGGSLIPVPPSSVEPVDFADWFDQTAHDKMTLQTLQLNTTVEKSTNESSSTKFVSRLDRMFETQNMEAGDVSMVTAKDTISMVKLRSALDICLEQLPLLLELGDVPQLMRAEYDFPYHCPSIISMSSAESTLMPESIGYVLLQECLWMNTVLCHIRQEINDLQINLLGGSGALPRRLLPTAHSLQEEYVPVSWIHPNCQPCTHSLVSWLEDLQKRHQQLNKWIRRSMVPTFVDGQLTENSTIARGQLTTVWLGGLVNPQALLTALRQEKAILSRANLEDVHFDCVVVNQIDHDELEIEEGGMFVTDMILENAAWDAEANSLKEAKGDGLTTINCVYLKPIVKVTQPKDKSEGQEDAEGQGEDRAADDQEGQAPPGVAQLPVYMNKSRQIQAWTLPVKCPEPAENWVLCRAAFILDAGLSEGGCKKSRAYLMLQRLPPMMRSSQEEEEEEEEEEHRDEEEDGEMGMEESGEDSTRSQLSYKAMSPKAPPLPEGLGLKRERPMYGDGDGDGDDGEGEMAEGGDEKRPQSQASRVSETLSRGKLSENGRKSVNGEENEKQEGLGDDNQERQEVDETGKSARGNEPDDEKFDRQGENDRGIENKEVEDAAAASGTSQHNVIDMNSNSRPGTQPENEAPAEIVHPGSRQGLGSKSSQRNAKGDEGQQNDGRASDNRATAESNSDTVPAPPLISKSKSQGRGVDEEAKLKEETAAKKPPSREKIASREKPVSREKASTSKPPSREKIASRGKIASRESTKGKGGQPTQGTESQNEVGTSQETGKKSPIVTQVIDDPQPPEEDTNEAGTNDLQSSRSKGSKSGDASRGQDVVTEDPAPPPLERSEDPDHMSLDLKAKTEGSRTATPKE